MTSLLTLGWSIDRKAAKLHPVLLCAGVNIAVKGGEDPDKPGHFLVEDICYPTLQPPGELQCEQDA